VAPLADAAPVADAAPAVEAAELGGIGVAEVLTPALLVAGAGYMTYSGIKAVRDPSFHEGPPAMGTGPHDMGVGEPTPAIAPAAPTEQGQLEAPGATDGAAKVDVPGSTLPAAMSLPPESMPAPIADPEHGPACYAHDSDDYTSGGALEDLYGDGPEVDALHETSARRAGVTGNPGRTGKQARLRELGNDDKAPSDVRGWIKNDQRQVEAGNVSAIRLPPGHDLAHERGREAEKGYSYQHSNLQGTDLHKLQHKYDDQGRKNRERPPTHDTHKAAKKKYSDLLPSDGSEIELADASADEINSDEGT
jgi:hypothetical protein